MILPPCPRIQAMALYRDRLGLRFENGADEELTLIFTLLDAAAPDREFLFTVKVTNRFRF